MICKKCKTAVPEHSPQCQNCGAVINKGATAKKIMGVMVIITMITVCGVYIYFQPNLFPVDEELPEQAAMVTDAPLENEVPGAPETAAPTVVPNLSTVSADVFDDMRTVYDSAADYFAAEEGQLISRRGFLYHIENKDYVTLQTLIDEDFLHDDYAAENILILYVAPIALSSYNEVRFTPLRELTLLTAYETKEGIAILSGQETGILYREHYNALIEQYAYDHGEITRPDSAAADYQSMLDRVISYSMISEDVFVRYAASDEKYGVIVITKASEPDRPEGFVLENIEGQYTIVFNNFETYDDFQAVINRNLPDLNIELLPEYSLYTARGEIKTDFPALISRLRADELITENDRIVFSSGTDRYAYIVFDTGMIIFGYMPASESAWNYTEVTNWYDAELRLMARESGPPPAYILWQN